MQARVHLIEEEERERKQTFVPGAQRAGLPNGSLPFKVGHSCTFPFPSETFSQCLLWSDLIYLSPKVIPEMSTPIAQALNTSCFLANNSGLCWKWELSQILQMFKQIASNASKPKISLTISSSRRAGGACGKVRGAQHPGRWGKHHFPLPQPGRLVYSLPFLLFLE